MKKIDIIILSILCVSMFLFGISCCLICYAKHLCCDKNMDFLAYLITGILFYIVYVVLIIVRGKTNNEKD